MYLCHADFIIARLIFIGHGLIIHTCCLFLDICVQITLPIGSRQLVNHHLPIMTILIKKSVYTEKKHKVIEQVYRVKKGGWLSKNPETLDIENPNIKESPATSIDQITPNVEHVSNDIAEKRSSSAEGQGKEKKAGNTPTGPTGSRVGLTGVPTGLTGDQTDLTRISSKHGNSSKAKKKMRLSFEELLVKYEKKKLFRSKRVIHIALEMQIHHQGIEGIKDLTNNKVIVLLHHVVLLGHIRHCLGHILVIMHPMTIIVCACNHTLF